MQKSKNLQKNILLSLFSSLNISFIASKNKSYFQWNSKNLANAKMMPNLRRRCKNHNILFDNQTCSSLQMLE